MLLSGQTLITRSMVEDRRRGSPTIVRWQTMPAQQRRDILERSLEEALTEISDPSITRLSVPEIRLDRLLANRGQGFIDLMESCCAPDEDGHNIRWIKHKRLESLCGSIDGARNRYERLYLDSLLSMRQNVLIDFVACAWSHVQGGVALTLDPATVDYKGLPNFCASCHRCDAGLDTPYRACSGCKRLGLIRQVFYCSETCQAAHWKAGHKRDCGQKVPLSGHAATFKEPTTQDDSPGRSIGLRAQMECLSSSSDPRLLYTIFISDKRYIVSLPDLGPDGKLLYKPMMALRDNAFTSRSREDIAGLYHLVTKFMAAGEVKLIDNGQVRASGADASLLHLAHRLQMEKEFDLGFEGIVDCLDEAFDKLQGPPPAMLNTGALLSTRSVKKSKALARQLDMIYRNPTSVYFLWLPDGQSAQAVPDYPGAADPIEKLRRWALRSEQKLRCVAEIYALLCRFMENDPVEGITRELVKKQLAAEYEVDMVAALRSHRSMLKKYPGGLKHVLDPRTYGVAPDVISEDVD